MRLAIFATLPLLVNCKSWVGSLYELTVYGAYPHTEYESFDLISPHFEVEKWSPRCSNEYILMEPRGKVVENPGPMITDAQGELIWMEDSFGEVMDLKVQTYDGEDYLTFWSGIDDKTHGRGKYYMLNSAYEVVHEVTAANGLEGDLHEFLITEQGTVLITIYEIIESDLSAFGRGSGYIYDGLFQEIDLATGELLFQWRASEHYSLEESFFDMTGDIGLKETSAWDFFHINSIDKDPAGNYYISSRYMHTVTCISPTGEVVWVLGGKRNDFRDLSDGKATDFTWQHHVNWHSNNTITIFDNGSTDKVKTAKHSRGMAVFVDTVEMTATLIGSYDAPGGFLSQSQGSVQFLPDSGNVFVGWGHTPQWTEFTAAGEVLCNMRFGAAALLEWGWVKSYRTFRASWVGRPNTIPSIQMSGTRDRVYVSWNGATEVHKWMLQSAESVREEEDIDDEMFDDIESVRRETFETSLKIPDNSGEYVRVIALDVQNRVLGSTLVVDRRTGNMITEDGEIIEAPKDDSESTTLFFCGFGIMTAAMFVSLFWGKFKFSVSSIQNWRRGFVRLSKTSEDDDENSFRL